MFPLMFPEERSCRRRRAAAKIASLTGVAGGTLLDLACGPGATRSHSHRPAPCDGRRPHAFSARAARERADRQAHRSNRSSRHARLREAGGIRPGDQHVQVVRLFRRPGGESPRADNVLTSLKPGGVFLLDHLGKELLAARFQPTRSESLPDGTLLVCRQTVINNWSRIDSEWILHCGRAWPCTGAFGRGECCPCGARARRRFASRGDASRFHLRHWLYSGWEMCELLTEAGFASVQLYGNLDGVPYGPEAQRLIAVGEIE